MLAKLFPPTAHRVQIHTSPKINERIKEHTDEILRLYRHSDVKTINLRLEELSHEWDTERILEANAAILIFVSTVFGFVFTTYWFIFVGIISFCLLQHALEGWCLPLPLIRRLGVRTPSEIAYERNSLERIKASLQTHNPESL